MTRYQAFINDIFDVYEKHGLAISHEDGHGSFIIARDTPFNRNWLCEAVDAQDLPEGHIDRDEWKTRAP